MTSQINLGLLQISTGPSKERNLEKVTESIDNLESDLDILVTPEYLMGLEDGIPSEELVKRNAMSVDSDFFDVLKEKAEETNTSILFTAYRKENGIFNSSIFVDETGSIRGVYDKIHLFDAFGYKESEIFQPGDDVVTFEWQDIGIGLATCFDLRFSELFRIMMFAGADLVLVPSGFYSGTYKENQWETLISARAHENNLFVVGVNQPKPHFVGKSTVASPLGYEVESLGENEEFRTVKIDMNEVRDSKEKMPMDKSPRFDLYREFDPYRTC